MVVIGSDSLTMWVLESIFAGRGWESLMTNQADAALIKTFYEAFSRHDAEAMASCYHADVVFKDPAFGELRGESVADMWRMLTKLSKDLKVKASGISVKGGVGHAHWDADYTFSATRRKVHNSIDSTFEFKDGLIYRQTDAFDFQKWSSQAFGPVGSVLGRTPVLPFAVTRFARRNLSQFQAKQAKKKHAVKKPPSKSN